MQFTTRQREGVTIADLSGRLTAGGGDLVFRNHVRGLIDGGVRSILLNMEGIDMMDSSGVGELTSAQKTSQSAGGTIKLLNVGSGVRRVLEMANILSLFEVFDNEPTAVASFRH